jgi:hypothetical protein
MKRVGYVFEKVVDIDNIKKAIVMASKGKLHRRNVQKILDNIDFYAKQLQGMMVNDTFSTCTYTKKRILDGARQKEREIFKPAFYPDQCIHWAIMLQLESILQRGMYDWCCASVKGRGTHYGQRYVKKILKNDPKNTKYCLQLDIRHFYPNIDRDILKQKFKRIIKDPKLLKLIFKIIDSVEEGVPIGNYTSQWFANFYLQDLDHFVKEKLGIKYYIRYMDDIVLFSGNKRKLRKAKQEIEKFLAKEKLQLKDNWKLFLTDSRPLDFLGFRFYRDHITLRRRNALRIRRRARKIKKRYMNEGYITFEDAAAMVSYFGWIKNSDSYKYYFKYISNYVTLKQCKEVIRNESNIRRKTRKTRVRKSGWWHNRCNIQSKHRGNRGF